MKKSSVEAPFTLKRVQEMLGLSRTTIAGLVAEGFVAPQRGRRNELRFSFQDLTLLRTALALQKAHIPPRKILRSLARLKADLPDELPLTGLRITAVGADVTVRDRTGQWQAETGQLLIDFEVVDAGGTVAFLARKDDTRTVDWFGRGVELEKIDAAAAEKAFRRALDSDPGNEAPYLNLGAMLCEAGRCDEAVALYERGTALHADKPSLHFNHAIALEDRQRFDEAADAYRKALALQPDFGDAHYNLALLLERLGDAQGTLRHLSAYRRLERGDGT